MKLTILSFLIVTSFSAIAGFEGSLSFTQEEKKAHINNIKSLTIEADDCLKQDLSHQQEFYKKYGISPFYGDRSTFSNLLEKEKIKFLVSRHLSPNLLQELSPTSCVGMTLKCLERGFRKTNQSETFRKLKEFVMQNDVDGSALQYGLQMLGWKIFYWNPDTNQNKAWDLQEKMADPTNHNHFRGFHEENYLSVLNNKRYYLNNVDDAKTLVNFGDSEPRFLKNIPFFVGTAHMGYHVFPGSYGEVTEAHSTRALTDPDTVQSAPFNPLANGGAPRGLYRSGIMSIPPTF